MNLQGPLGQRRKEHLKVLSPIYDHVNIPGHLISMDSFSLCRGSHRNARTMNIRVIAPSLNRNIGKQCDHAEMAAINFFCI